MDFEEILHRVGGYGKYQKLLTVGFLVPVSFVLPWFWMNSLFMVSVPEHWCHVPQLVSSNLTIAQQRRLISPPADSSCSMYQRDYSMIIDDIDTTIFNSTYDIIPCNSGWEYDKTNFDFTAASQFNLVCDKRHFPSMVLSLQNVGSLFGTPIYGFLSDRFGRKSVFLLTGIVVTVSELASAFSGNFIIFAICRTLSGTVRPTLLITAYVLSAEIVSPEMRAHMNGILNNVWTVGFCLVPLIAYISKNWVILGVISAGAGATLVLQCLYIPESPCWLVSQGKYKKAADIMMNVAKINGKNENYSELLMDLEILGEKIEKVKKKEKKVSGSKLLKYPRLRRNFFILSACWAGFLLIYNGLTYNIVNLNGNEFFNFFILAVVEMPGNILFWYCMDKAGRRWTASIGFAVMAFVCLIPLFDFPLSDIIGSAAGKLMISGIVMVTDQQAAELFPTVVRSFCMSTGKTVGTAVSLLTPYLAYLSTFGKDIPFVIIAVTGFVTAVLAALLPETLNRKLPQTITDAEEFGKDQKFFSWVRKEQESISMTGAAATESGKIADDVDESIQEVTILPG